MHRRAELSLADVLEAFDRLRPQDAASRELLLRALDPQGLLTRLARDGRSERNERPPSSRSRPIVSEQAVAGAPGAAREELAPPRIVSEQEQVVTVRKKPVRKTFAPWSFPPTEMLELPPPSLPVMSPPSPLFVPGWHAGILSAALAVPQPEGPLDVPKAVELLARQTPLKSFPRRRVPSLRLGVRVLLDVSESMMPFARDREQLLTRVRAVVGTDRVEVQRFEGAPSRGVWGRARFRLEPFEPPAGTPVLVLSDVGIGGDPLGAQRADVSEWLDFAKVARRAGSRVVALVPYGPARWPRALRRHMVLIHWDRATTARSVLQALQG